jgi:hypothetical protein
MVMRVAYLSRMHNIPRECVVNAYHTGIMLAQARGRCYHAGAVSDSRESQNLGHKEQFTALASASAVGHLLKWQLVFQGSTAGTIPKLKNISYKETSSGMEKKKTAKTGDGNKVVTIKVMPKNVVGLQLESS